MVLIIFKQFNANFICSKCPQVSKHATNEFHGCVSVSHFLSKFIFRFQKHNLSLCTTYNEHQLFQLSKYLIDLKCLNVCSGQNMGTHTGSNGGRCQHTHMRLFLFSRNEPVLIKSYFVVCSCYWDCCWNCGAFGWHRTHSVFTSFSQKKKTEKEARTK